jgi:hypothetical protein
MSALLFNFLIPFLYHSLLLTKYTIWFINNDCSFLWGVALFLHISSLIFILKIQLKNLFKVYLVCVAILNKLTEKED